MNTDVYDFDIPEHLIAQKPADRRSEARLLVYNREKDEITDTVVNRISTILDDSYFLVFNNSKVIPSRMFITRLTGSKGELLVLKVIDEHTIEVLTDKAKKYKKDTPVILPDGSPALVIQAEDPIKRHFFCEKPIFTMQYFETYGHVPLPPYIRKDDDAFDKERYQTVYSRDYGSAAAPTAGLHFEDSIFRAFEERGICYDFVSLHVGLGTFQPIYADHIEDHKIHAEEYYISPQAAANINKALEQQKTIIPVGTTSLRTLETAAVSGRVPAGPGESRLYIYPPYQFKIARGLFTNFHTPKSSLLVLISALLGLEKVKELYAYAIEKEYRFFSYGDAMLIL